MIHITDREKCCGCEACIQRCPQQCITLHEDGEGFLYPETDEGRCIDCGLCEKVCPVIFQGTARRPLNVYAAKNPDEEIRWESSSGGVFTLLAEKILSEGGVVFGARFDARWEVVHDYTENVEGLSAFRGSKYVQSRIGDSFRQTECFLKTGRKVLFSGTPCQIAGLKLFLKKEYDNLLTVDFICHGVPSPGVWRKYLKEIAARRAAGKNTVLYASLNKSGDVLRDISFISFRDKTLSWKKFSFVVCFSATDGAEKNSVLLSEDLHTNLFLKGFLADLYLRPSCYACPVKKLKSGSDLTIGDFWGVEYVLPRIDDGQGVSIIMSHNLKGQNICSSLNCDLWEIAYEQVIKGNSAVTNSCIKPLQRKIFFDRYESVALNDLIVQLTQLGCKQRLRRFIKNILLKSGLLVKIKRYANRNSHFDR